MRYLAILFVLISTGCATVREHPITPFSCDYEGGINLTNAKMLHIENITTSSDRPNWFDNRDTVLVGGAHYSLVSMQPILMCIDPKISSEISFTTKKAAADISRRHSVMVGAFGSLPLLPLAGLFPPVAIVMASAAGVISYTAGWVHEKFFEPNVSELNNKIEAYNFKLANRLRNDDRVRAYTSRRERGEKLVAEKK